MVEETTMINVQLLNDEVYINCQNYAKDIADKIKEHPDSSDWMIAFGNGNPFDDTDFQIEDFDVTIPFSRDDNKAITQTAISMHKALRDLPGHIVGDVRFWAWLTFTKMYKFLNAIFVPTEENVKSMVVPKAITTRRMTMLQIIGRYYFMCDLVYSSEKDNPYYLADYLVKRIELYRNLVYRNISDIPTVAKSVIIAQKDYEDKHPGVSLTGDHSRLLMKEVSSLGSVRLIDAIPEDELLAMVKEKMKLVLEDGK